MDRNLYTIVLDFQGGTYLAQVEAADDTDAMRRWATQLAVETVAGRSSAKLARTMIQQLDDGDAPVAVEGLLGVRSVTALVGRSLAIATLIQSR